MTKCKTAKIQFYYPLMERNGKFDAFSRRFIHRNNGGLWASARDLSLKERMGANSKDIENTIIFEVNYNEKIIIRWQDLFILFNNRTYKITAKPDEFDYTQNKGSIKIQATQCEDNNHYEQEQYEV